MKLGRPSRKLFLITLPSILPVGLKIALMRSRKKYLKQQKYTPSMKMNSFLDVSEEQGCVRDNISDVLAVYFENSGSQVLFCLLFYLLLPTELFQTLLHQNTLEMLFQDGDSYSIWDNLDQWITLKIVATHKYCAVPTMVYPLPEGVLEVPSFTAGWKGSSPRIPGRECLWSGLGLLKSAILWSLVFMGVCI